MDPRTSPSVARKSRDSLPFYQPPQDRAHLIPAKIVSEARNAIVEKPGLRVINTRRPETPREEQRKLFGEQSVRDPTNRPPSAFSLGSKHFDSESRPVSGATRLEPLPHKPRVSDTEQTLPPKPPTDPNRSARRPASRTKHLQQSISVDASNETQISPEKQKHKTNGSRERKSSTENNGDGDAYKSSKSRRPKYTTAEADPQDAAASVTGRVESGYASDYTRDGSASSKRTEGSSSIASTRENSASSQRGGSASSSSQRGGSANSQRGGSAGERKGSAGNSERGGSAGKPGSAGRREEETPEEAHTYNTRVGPLVDEMATHIKDKNTDRLIGLSETLYSVMQETDMLGKNCKRRSGILKTVFKLLDLESPRLLLKLARLILALKVGGNNLTNVCKLVFKVSRDDKNDVHFTEGNILDLLIETAHSADHLASADALVYCVGSLKFLSGTSTVVKHLVKRHCVDSMARLLAAINNTNAENGKSNEQLGHILVQVTATLRNMADISSTRGQFTTCRIPQELCRVMDMYTHDGDLMLNVVRIFSKMTQHTSTEDALWSQSSHFKSLLDLLSRYKKREDLVVRVSFILGNVTAKNESARRKLFDQHRCMETLLHVLKHYLEQDLKTKSSTSVKSGDSDAGETESKATKTEDVLIKTVRVVANLSINAEVGPQIAANEGCLELLLQVLDRKSLQSSEELVLNTLATINNLSFYSITHSAITRRQIDVAETLMKFIQRDHIEGLAEATRVFGNLSREKPVRDFLVHQKMDEVMVALLNSNNREVVFTACGVLINLMADEEKRPVLLRHRGVPMLIDALRDFAKGDWQLGSLVCQTLWNYSGKITSSNATFGETEAQELVDLLLELLDEEEAMLTSDSDTDSAELRDYNLELWRSEFYPVASSLLQRIETHQSHFEPLEHPT